MYWPRFREFGRMNACLLGHGLLANNFARSYAVFADHNCLRCYEQSAKSGAKFLFTPSLAGRGRITPLPTLENFLNNLKTKADIDAKFRAPY